MKGKEMTKFFALIVTIAISLGLSGHLKSAVMKMATLAATAQHHQLSFAKFSRALTHCDIGTPEFATKACAKSRRKLNFRGELAPDETTPNKSRRVSERL
jgi:hypothetical protein